MQPIIFNLTNNLKNAAVIKFYKYVLFFEIPQA